MTPLLVVTTLGSRADAESLAHALVEAGLAACAQISEITSVYRWQGRVQQEPEFRLLLKTLPARYAELEAAILARHPYALPALHAIATSAAHAAYAEWVNENSRGAALPPPRPAE